MKNTMTLTPLLLLLALLLGSATAEPDHDTSHILSIATIVLPSRTPLSHSFSPASSGRPTSTDSPTSSEDSFLPTRTLSTTSEDSSLPTRTLSTIPASSSSTSTSTTLRASTTTTITTTLPPSSAPTATSTGGNGGEENFAPPTRKVPSMALAWGPWVLAVMLAVGG
ncbi:hypothetical protein FN846DRAFT_478276 [Sphaerosporella brunnea]|uniref:GPI anchored protein n=1 Tax=Sphaerosporella brunnea TaxID=1250544 RepID=A0A5J5FAK5_9PEZI|nr:hypothetical protein FN846DRAFT_478276 [Sphaerosporella brunnea]